MTENSQLAPSLDSLTCASGRFAMVAIDQRESLRAMFRAAGGLGSDQELTDFKAAAAELLSAHSSALLVDRLCGLEAARVVLGIDHCGLILAADILEYDRSGVVVTTRLDSALFDAPTDSLHPEFGELGPAALKLLLLWDTAAADEAETLARDFMTRCRGAGKIGLLEVKVRAPSADARGHADVLLEAARRLAPTQPDVYKTEVPFFGNASERGVIEACEQITQALPCPWVVLSSGVAVEQFPEAVAMSCRGGASGFLAGRAVWSEAVHPVEYRGRLATTALARLDRLVEIVEA
jgi:sulfofructosephosphate aldolase